MTSKADKLPLETEPVAHDNNTILKPGDQTLLRLTQLIIVVKKYGVFIRSFETNPKTAHLLSYNNLIPRAFLLAWERGWSYKIFGSIEKAEHPSLRGGGGGGWVEGTPRKIGWEYMAHFPNPLPCLW